MSFVYPIVTATDPAGRRNALNEALQAGQEYLLLLPEGITLTEEMLQAFADAAKNAPADVAVLAARVLPWGPDWHCSPITLEADCMRLEAVLVNCMLAAAAGGFDKHLIGAARMPTCAGGGAAQAAGCCTARRSSPRTSARKTTLWKIISAR